MKLADAIENTETFSQLYEIVKDAKPSYSFWTGRVITVNGYESSEYIRHVLLKTIQINDERPRITDIHSEENKKTIIYAKKLDDVLTKICLESLEQYRPSSNCAVDKWFVEPEDCVGSKGVIVYHPHRTELKFLIDSYDELRKEGKINEK